MQKVIVNKQTTANTPGKPKSMNFQDIFSEQIEHMGKYQSLVILTKWLWLISGLPTALKALKHQLAMKTSHTVLLIGILRQKDWQGRDFRAYWEIHCSTP